MKHVLGFFALITLAASLTFAQTSGNTADQQTTPTTNQAANPNPAINTNDTGRHSDWGWLGLIGLIGLAGLGGRRHDGVVCSRWNVSFLIFVI